MQSLDERRTRETVIHEPGTITALAAIFGSLAGAFASSVGTWITQRHQTQRDLLEKRILLREQLYSDFISESARILVDALEHELKDADRLITAYALLNRMRLSSSQAVLDSADKVVKDIVSAYAEPNLSPEEILSRHVNGADPLKEFSELCRSDLEFMQRQLP
jgi:hypothetical protein